MLRALPLTGRRRLIVTIMLGAHDWESGRIEGRRVFSGAVARRCGRCVAVVMG